MIGVSGGAEPVFANYYERKTESLHQKDYVYKVYTPIVQKYMEENGIVDDRDLPGFFITAQNLNYKNRIDMQGVWQNRIDASISSTVNVPEEFTVDETEELYRYAWEKGLKGVTIFRAGCKRAGILTVAKNKDEDEVIAIPQLARGEIVQACDESIGRKRKLTTGCGSLHCTAFFDPDSGELVETYLSKGSTGGCANFMTGLSRMISLSARAGVGIKDIVDQLNSCGTCPSYAVRTATKRDTSKGACCPIAVGNALTDMYKEIQNELGFEESAPKAKPKPTVAKRPDIKQDRKSEVSCQECGEPLIFEGGCNTCKSCGWSKCS